MMEKTTMRWEIAIPDERTLLERYELVGGADDMVPRLRRVARALAENPAVAAEYKREAEALFVRTPYENIEKWTSIPFAAFGEDIGAFNMAVALASVPMVAETHARFGFPAEQLARTFSWFRAMIAVYARRHGGVSGIAHTRTWWFRNHVDGTLFRFGNMEFLRGPCPDFVPAEFRATLGPEDEVPTFHYPGGAGGLDPKAVKAAFAEATQFWKRAFGRYPKAYACDSWLFNEHWPELMPGTRIAQAIDLYDRLPSLPPSDEHPSGLFYCYAADDVDPRDWPQENALERAYATLFDRGVPLCDGCAWVKVDEKGRVLFRASE